MTILMIGEGKVGLNSWAWIRRPSPNKFDNIKNSSPTPTQPSLNKLHSERIWNEGT